MIIDGEEATNTSDFIHCSCGAVVCSRCYENNGHWEHDTNEENIWLSQAIGYANEKEYEEPDYYEEDEGIW